jgi:hypothetical protein
MLVVVDTILFPRESLGRAVRIFASIIFPIVSCLGGVLYIFDCLVFAATVLMSTGFEVQETMWPIDWEARVEYALIAKVERSSGGSKLFGTKLGKSRSLEETLQLRLQDNLDDPFVDDLLARSSLLTFKKRFDEPRGPWLTRKLSMLSKTASDQTGTDEGEAFSYSEDGGAIIFDVEIASVVRASSSRLPYKIKVSITDEAREAAMRSITICGVRVNLLRKTSVRDDSLSAIDHTAMQIVKQTLCQRKDMNEKFKFERSSDHEWSKLPSYEDEKGTQAARLRNVDAPGWRLNMTDMLRLPEPEWLTPTFATYNIAVEYSLDFEVKIQVSDSTVISLKSIEHAAGNPKILVLPSSPPNTGSTGKLDAPQAEAVSVIEPSSKEAEAIKEASEARREQPEEDSLPAYEP